MHGLIFVTWEKYLAERFGNSFLNAYREAIGETPATAPLASRIYDDAVLLAGVGAASRLAHFPVDTLLREYGRYFIINELTSHLCSYLLTQAHSGYDLLLLMRKAHAQMRHTEGLTPPVFSYEALSTYANGLVLVYENHRQLCPVLYGAIEGAAERFGEKVHIIERACMKRGAAECRFEIYFSANSGSGALYMETPEQLARRKARRQLADMVLSALPDQNGVTLMDLQKIMQHWQVNHAQLRPSMLLEALQHLQHAGLVASTANQPGDDLTRRRYWRAPTDEQTKI
jgi:Haem-NO-binding